MNNLINHIELSLKKTEKNISNIDNDILNIDGMSGKKTRHFYNNICSMKDARYLEIGVWKGSSLCAAMSNNHNLICLAIDNWSEFGGPKKDFFINFNKYKVSGAKFIEKNCWDIDSNNIGKFNIYMYDGNHSQQSHFNALTHFLNCLDDEFIFLVDDWNCIDIINATLGSIEKNNLTILFKYEIFTNNGIHPPYFPGPGDRAGKYGNWHNGICIFILKKN